MRRKLRAWSALGVVGVPVLAVAVLVTSTANAYATGAVVVDVSDSTQWATQPIGNAVPVEAITANPAEVSALEALYALNPGDATADDAMKPVTMTSDALNTAEGAGEGIGFESGELAPVAVDGALLAPVAVAVAGFYAGWKIGKWLGGAAGVSNDTNCDSSAPSGQCIQGGGSAPAILWGGIVSHSVWGAHGSFYLTGVVGHAYDAAGYTPSVNPYPTGMIRSVRTTWTNRCSGSSGIVQEHQDWVDVPGSDAIHFTMDCSQSSAILLSTTLATTTAVEVGPGCDQPNLTMVGGATCTLTNGGLITVDTPGAFTVQWDDDDDPDAGTARTLTYQQECVDNTGAITADTGKIEPSSDTPPTLSVPACPLGTHRLDAKVFDDPRLGGKLVAEMGLPDEDANPARQALTSTGATPQPLTGTDPDYGDCTWDGVAVKAVDCKKAKPTTDTGSDPSPSPSVSASAAPGDGTGPGGVPSGAASPTDACFPSGWGWLNPVEWVLKPVECALSWAFKPDPATMTADEATLRDGFEGTVVGQAFTTVGHVFSAFTDDSGSDCEGPGIPANSIDPILSTSTDVIHPLEACSGFSADVAGFMRPWVTVALFLGAAFSCWYLLAKSIGAPD